MTPAAFLGAKEEGGKVAPYHLSPCVEQSSKAWLRMLLEWDKDAALDITQSFGSDC